DTKWKEFVLSKPYNSILGEQFLNSWEVPALPPSDRTSIDSGTSGSTLVDGGRKLKVYAITEQISHHPPVSAFYNVCPEKGIIARGVDHISARFTGTSVKVGAGEQNFGIYVGVERRGEEYNVTHPWASVNGWLGGSPYVVVSDTAVVRCAASGLKAILEYKDEPMFGRPRFAIEGKIVRYDSEEEASLSEKERREREKLCKIPDASVLATISGQWNGKVFAQLKGEEKPRLLFDMATSSVAEKIVRPIAEQGENESRRIWQHVTAGALDLPFTPAPGSASKPPHPPIGKRQSHRGKTQTRN
ncbi:hypothetical protein BDK51DRAFT_20095, partial [Blyttiomyces helicus]